MKICKVTIENLNSLRGKFTIDFEDPKIASRGLFLITGDTGSGKTTILDGITLALFGRTARLEKISGASNELMTKGTGFCSATVVFHEKGERYTAQWSQRRARDTANGKLQDITWKLAKGDTILSQQNRSKDTGPKIESIIGMKYDQFTKSVLLAQGQFAKFLQSSGNERTAILGSLTGTASYEAISKAVYRNYSNRNADYKTQEQILASIIILSEEEKQQKQVDEKDALENRKAVIDKTKQIDDLLDAWKRFEAREKDKHAITSLEADIRQRAEASHEHLSRLSRHQEATEVDPLFSVYDSTRTQVTSQQKAIAESKNRVGETAKQEQEAKAQQQKVEENSTCWQEERARRVDTLQKAKAIEEKLQELLPTLTAAQVQQKSAEQKVREAQSKLNDLTGKQQNLEKQLASYTSFLSVHQADKELTTTLSGLEEKQRQLKEKQESLARAEKQASPLHEAWLTAQAIEAKAKKAFDSATVAEQNAKLLVDEKEKVLAELLQGGELQSLRLNLEKVQEAKTIHEKVMGFKEQRALLHSGEACPLCGSTEHPYCKELPAESSYDADIKALRQRISLVETAQKELDSAKKAWETKRSESDHARKPLEEAKAKTTATQIDYTTMKTTRDSALNDVESSRKQLEAAAKSYGIESWNDQSWSTLVKRRDDYEKNQKSKSDSEGALATLLSDMQGQQKMLVVFQEDQKDKNDTLVKRTSQRDSYTTERKALLPGSIEEAENSIARYDKKLEEMIKKSDDSYDAAKSAHDKAVSKLDEQQEALRGFEADLKIRESRFQEKLQEKQFLSEQDYLSYKLSPSEISRFKEEQRNLEEAKAKLKGMEDAYQAGENVTQPETDKDDLLKQHDELEQQGQHISEEIGSIRRSLEDDKTAKQRRDAQEKVVQDKKKALDDWELLNQLIGSANGKNFSGFAQNITFKRFIVQANKQLRTLSGRYLLCAQDDVPLEFFVHDMDEGDTIRSVKNLSGGETFLVSLALALALSTISIGGTKVDSLFLDEGFGTLDGDSINQAMMALDKLRQEGKTIGIISHVEQLKEYIPVQIIATKLSGGVSTLSGAGVSL